jgi:hypothetical protein
VIIDLQRRLAEIGRIRIGQTVTSANGKARPAKLETFRLTSADRTRIDLAAGMFGGKPRQWDAPAGRQWEVITTVDALDVIVPPSDMAFSQWYELWSAGGCQRRCDGQLESISDGPCLCDPERRDCDVHTRLSVMLANLPGLGVWRIDTSGYYAAVELQGAVEVIHLAAGRGQMLPARLRLEQRVVKRSENGKPVTRRFAVPVLDIEVSPAQLLGGAPARAALDTGQQRQLAAPVDNTASLTPVPDTVPTRPARSVAEQARAVDTPAERKPRKNAAQPIPATGIAPRTAAEAKAAAPVIGADEDAAPQPDSPADETPPDMITAEQNKAIQAGFTALGIRNRPQRLAIISKIVGRQISSNNDLYRAEAATVINEINDRRARLAQADEEAQLQAAYEADMAAQQQHEDPSGE